MARLDRELFTGAWETTLVPAERARQREGNRIRFVKRLLTPFVIQ